MNMQEFFEKYNLNKYNFASIAGVGTRSLIKYAKGEKLRKGTIARIEKAIFVAEKYQLKRPVHEGGFDPMYNSHHCCEVLRYEQHFRELIEKEP